MCSATRADWEAVRWIDAPPPDVFLSQLNELGGETAASLERENERIAPPAEHISRKWGQWYRSPKELLEQLEERGFRVGDPAFELIGMGDSGVKDIAEKHDEYLAQEIEKE